MPAAAGSLPPRPPCPPFLSPCLIRTTYCMLQLSEAVLYGCCQGIEAHQLLSEDGVEGLLVVQRVLLACRLYVKRRPQLARQLTCQLKQQGITRCRRCSYTAPATTAAAAAAAVAAVGSCASTTCCKQAVQQLCRLLTSAGDVCI